MIDPETLLAQPLVTALGWALIHFTWQGALVALLLAGVLRVLQARSTNIRYAAACAALLLMSLAPLVTITIIGSSRPGKTANGMSPVFLSQSEPKPLAVEIETVSAPDQTAGVISAPSRWSSVWSMRLASSLPWMILLWLLGVVFFSLRLMGGWLYTQRLKSHKTLPLDDQWRQTLKRLCAQLRVRRPVRLLESALVQVPMVIGWLRPVILIPAGALTGLTPQQLEAIIAHELAHIRRHDYLVNLLQAVVETLLFYHPAVWWVSRRIRQEREHCCDDLAVAVCGDALTYARALLEMEQLRAVEPQLAMAANGGLLMNRIQRLVGAQQQAPNRFTGLVAVIVALIAVVSAGAGAQSLLPSSIADSAAIAGAQNTGRQTVNEPLLKDGRLNSGAALLKGEQLNPVETPIKEESRQSGGESLSQTLNSFDPEELAAAACSLGKLGSVKAIPGLINLLGNDTPIQSFKCWDSGDWSPARHVFKQASPGEQAAIALASLSQPAIEPLIAALNNGNSSVRKNAAWAIGEIRGGLGTDRSAAVEPLIAALSDEDEWVRMAAAFSLGEMRPQQATESLIASLVDAEWRVRDMAARALGEMKARAAVERLTALSLNDENGLVRRKAAWALGEIGDSQSKESNFQTSGEIDYNVKFVDVTKTIELDLPARFSGKGRLKISGQLDSGSAVWTLRDPNGKSVFTAESVKGGISLDSGDLDVISGKWTLQMEVKNSTLHYNVRWNVQNVR